MAHLLELVYEYQLLLHKQLQFELPLDDHERAKYFGLRQLLMGDVPAAAGRAMPRLPLPGRVQFTVPGGFGAGKVRNISGEGIAIETRELPEVGTRVLVRLVSGSDATEYAFPGRVAWRSKVRRVMGVAFDGAPSCAPYLDAPLGAWSKDLRLGHPGVLPLSA